MTGSSPMSIQAKCAPAPIAPTAIQIPKAMIPTEIESEHASFMMTSTHPCLSDECQSVGKFGDRPRPATQPHQPARKGREGECRGLSFASSGLGQDLTNHFPGIACRWNDRAAYRSLA